VISSNIPWCPGEFNVPFFPFSLFAVLVNLDSEEREREVEAVLSRLKLGSYPEVTWR
jgi:hypothetical protein